MFLIVKVGRFEVEVIVSAIIEGQPEYRVHNIHDTKEHHPDFDSKQENIFEVKHNLGYYVKKRFEEVTL